MLNILDIIFLGLAFAATFTGVLINNFEKHVPAFIIKGYRYGSFAYKGNEANFLQLIEIPKAWYRHFYLFSSIFGAVTLSYMVLVYYFDYSVFMYIPVVLRLLLEQDEPSGKCICFPFDYFLLPYLYIRHILHKYYIKAFKYCLLENLLS